MSEGRIPDGYVEVIAYVGRGEIIVFDDHGNLGDLPESHDCDQMGCGTLDHVWWRGRLEVERD